MSFRRVLVAVLAVCGACGGASGPGAQGPRCPGAADLTLQYEATSAGTCIWFDVSVPWTGRLTVDGDQASLALTSSHGTPRTLTGTVGAGCTLSLQGTSVNSMAWGMKDGQDLGNTTDYHAADVVELTVEGTTLSGTGTRTTTVTGAVGSPSDGYTEACSGPFTMHGTVQAP